MGFRFDQEHTRRRFVVTGLSAVGAGMAVAVGSDAADETQASRQPTDLAGAIGLVSASAHTQTSGRAEGRNFTLLEMPQILREELDLTVLDLNTMSFPSFGTVSAAYIDRLRHAADKAGCVMTNLKMNQRGLQMNSPDPEIRSRALAEYKRSIDVASELGCRWVRPLPQKETPDTAIHVAGYQELCEYGAKKNVQLLVENFGWMQNDPDSVPKLVQAIGSNVAACPDTGNWSSNAVRYEGLKKVFPLAVTCDFKAKKLGPDGEHDQYDLKRCFDIGWEAGFRGPWAIEHGNANTEKLLAGIGLVRDMLRKWTAEKSSTVLSQR